MFIYYNVSEGSTNKPSFTDWREAELIKILVTNLILLISFWTHSKFLRMNTDNLILFLTGSLILTGKQSHDGFLSVVQRINLI